MSLDYPYYQELRRRKHKAAIWWRIGDILYYLGPLIAVAAIAIVLMNAYQSFFGTAQAVARTAPWRSIFLVSGVLLAFGAALHRLGRFLKGRAYRMGERDGISAGAVYVGQGDRPDPSTGDP